MSAETRTPRWAPETVPQWEPCHLDSHREKTTGNSGALTLWLYCSWNKLLVRLARGELVHRLSLVSPKVFSPFCHRWSFGSLPLSPLACLVGDTSFPAISSTWLHGYYLNWTELDDSITKFNNEMPENFTEIWVLNLVFTLLTHYFAIWYCAVALLQFVLLKALKVLVWKPSLNTKDTSWNSSLLKSLSLTLLQALETLFSHAFCHHFLGSLSAMCSGLHASCYHDEKKSHLVSLHPFILLL